MICSAQAQYTEATPQVDRAVKFQFRLNDTLVLGVFARSALDYCVARSRLYRVLFVIVVPKRFP